VLPWPSQRRCSQRAASGGPSVHLSDRAFVVLVVTLNPMSFRRLLGIGGLRATGRSQAGRVFAKMIVNFEIIT
jgi:hypothetical protein